MDQGTHFQLKKWPTATTLKIEAEKKWLFIFTSSIFFFFRTVGVSKKFFFIKKIQVKNNGGVLKKIWF